MRVHFALRSVAWRLTAATAIGLSLVTFAFAEDQPRFERDGSRFTATWNSNTVGQWRVVDEFGRECARGSMNPGRNQVRLDKLASPNDVRFQIFPARNESASKAELDQAERKKEFEVPGDRRVSRLAKPDRSSVIYQLPPRTYTARGTGGSRSGRLNTLTTERLQEIKELGVDYIWMTGVLEHASRGQTDPDVVKGDGGSYYAIYDNWDVSDQVGSLEDFENFLERAHSVGLRVLIDYVANHTARVHRTDIDCKQPLDFGGQDREDVFFDRNNNYYHITGESFSPPMQNGVPGADGVFDTDVFAPGVQLESPARVTGNDIISATPQVYDWFETVKLNYGWDLQNKRAEYDPRPRTWDQMLDVARYWVEKGVDGFRVDYAHAVPIEFWRYFSSELRKVNEDVFLLAEAYESDQRMRLPGFSYQAILDAGFDSVYNSKLYWAMHNQASQPDNMRRSNLDDTPAMRREMLERGYVLTNYMENHDEIRVASRYFSQWVGDRGERAELGLAYTTYVGLMPSHLLIHGGQEVQEDASIFGNFAGDNGRTSIFDFVHQSQVRTWLYESRPAWMVEFRERYKKMLQLKQQVPFSLPNSYENRTYIGLDGANWYKEQSKWVASYVRYDEDSGKSYLVVINSDPFASHEATIHFTWEDGQDTMGALNAMGITNSGTRYRFREVLTREGWEPQDPAIAGPGFPGDVLWRSGNVPSGLHLGDIPPSTVYVFEIFPIE